MRVFDQLKKLEIRHLIDLSFGLIPVFIAGFDVISRIHTFMEILGMKLFRQMLHARIPNVIEDIHLSGATYLSYLPVAGSVGFTGPILPQDLVSHFMYTECPS